MQSFISNCGAVFRRVMVLDRFSLFMLGTLVVVGGAFLASEVVSRDPDLRFFRLEKDRAAPIDRGLRANARGAVASPGLVLGQAPNGGGTEGLFGAVIPWPIIPLHMNLLPDGRVLTFGTDKDGAQGAQLVYDIWDPTHGTGPTAHQTLTNTTATDIFCGAASVIGAGLAGSSSMTGKVLILGGDLTIGGVRNYSNNKITVFNPDDNGLTSASRTMKYARWYPSISTMPNGDRLVLGGALSPGISAEVPEIYSPTTGWRALSGIKISDTYEWFYPRGFVGRDGGVYLLQYNTKIFRLTTAGAGTMIDTGAQIYPSTSFTPSVWLPNSFPFKVLLVRVNKKVQVADLSKYPPDVKYVDDAHFDRLWGNLTLLPDGKVLMTGGSGVYNELTDIAYRSEMFDPKTGSWTLGASASVPRLYHSATLLLPDGSVLTGGGGAPGPLANLNAEIYYPHYLFDAAGNPAPRPTIVSAPATVKQGKAFQFTVGPGDLIRKVNLVRIGANTHSFDPEQRLSEVSFNQSGAKITGYVDPNPRQVPPGYYMLFAMNAAGTPAVAKIVSIPQAIQ